MTGVARDGALWAVLAMEAALALPLISGITARSAPWPLLGTLVAVALLPAGFLAVRRWPLQVRAGRRRLGVGFGLALGLRLLVEPPRSLGPADLAGALLGAVVPAAIGLALWWRGAHLGEAELTAGDVRAEFTYLVAGLFALLTIFRVLIVPDPSLLGFSVLLFLSSGLAASALARQDAAGGTARAPAGRNLVAAAVAVPVLVGFLLLAGLRPPVLAAFWSLLQVALTLLLNGLLWLLQPLFWLLSQWRPELSQQPPRLPAPGAGGLGDLANREPPPDWVVWLVLLVVGTLALLGLVIVVWVVLALLAPGWFRFRTRGRSPVALESEGGVGEDARALLAGVGRWLSARLRPRPAPSAAITDARAAYRALLRWAKQEHAIQREAPETPARLRARLEAAIPPGAETYALLTDAYERARYGEQPASPEETARLRQAVATLPPRAADGAAAG